MQLTAVLIPAAEGGFVAMNPDTGTTTQGDTIEETKNNLRLAIELIMEDRTADILRGLPEDVIREKVLIG